MRNATLGVRACVFELSGRLFAVDLGEVRSVQVLAERTRVPRGPAHLLGMVNVHGAIVPVLDSRVLLGFPARAPDAPLQTVLIASDPLQVAITVDRVLGLEAFGADAIAPSDAEVFELSPFASGVVRRGDGWVEMLDVSKIVHSLAPGAVR